VTGSARSAGQLIGGQGSLNPSGRPANEITSLRQKYMHRLPELFDGLLEMATNSPNPMVRLAATRELLDRLLGKPAIFVEQTRQASVAELYLSALRRANQVADGIPSETVIDDDNSNPGAASKIQ